MCVRVQILFLSPLFTFLNMEQVVNTRNTVCIHVTVSQVAYYLSKRQGNGFLFYFFSLFLFFPTRTVSHFLSSCLFFFLLPLRPLHPLSMLMCVCVCMCVAIFLSLVFFSHLFSFLCLFLSLANYRFLPTLNTVAVLALFQPPRQLCPLQPI